MGHVLFVALGSQVIAIDPRQEHPAGESDVLWPSQTSDRLPRDLARPRRSPQANQARANHRPVYHSFGRKRLAGSAGSILSSLGPVTPRGVVFQDDTELKCVDPLSGVTLWSRTDLPPDCELFGDNEYVFAADVSGNVAFVVRLIDGELLGKRTLPNADWLLAAGRNVAQLKFDVSHSSRVMHISVTDIWSQKPLYQLELPATARLSIIEPNALAAFDPGGQFRVIDVQSGRLVIDEKLAAVPDVQAIHTMLAGDDLFLFITGPCQPQFKSVGQLLDYPLINGPVYAFNLTSGKRLWSGPALVRNRGIFLPQPSDVPLLIFADRQMTRDATAGGGSQLRLLCLDKRTGESVYRNDRLPDTSTTRFRVRAESDTHPLVTLEIGGSNIKLTLTDQPTPPKSPANDDLEVSQEMVEGGLRGLGEKILRGALEKGSSSTPMPKPEKSTKQHNGETKPTKNSTNDPDDD